MSQGRAGVLALVIASGLSAATLAGPQAPPDTAFQAAQRLFYNARYDAAAARAAELRAAHPDDLATYELRTSALLFQLRRAIGDPPDKTKALKQCVPCPALMAAFKEETAAGQARTRELLKKNPHDEMALFYLGKLDLNHVWLHLGTLGRRTGWGEYWEARRSLDAVLKKNPAHVRASVARAWIDYIVDTRVPWGVRWTLGGGNKKKALQVARQAADANADFFTKAEAVFALWEMQIREKDFAQAVVTARRLARDFPKNPEVAEFLAIRGKSRP
jgi:tetratricopeptide (TPR) repeat protein